MTAQLPTIPEYFQKFVDPKVDLEKYPQIPCPFHHEEHGKSFSYSRDLKMWRCFGQCHCGGDVINLHKLNYKLKTREEAQASLCALYGVKITHEVDFTPKVYEVDEERVHRQRVYSLALSLANDPESWLKLDYILSKVPFDVRELEVFCTSYGVSL